MTCSRIHQGELTWQSMLFAPELLTQSVFPPYRVPHAYRLGVESQVTELLQHGEIELSTMGCSNCPGQEEGWHSSLLCRLLEAERTHSPTWTLTPCHVGMSLLTGWVVLGT